MKKILLVFMIVSLLFVCGANFAVAEPKVIKWRMQCAYPPGDGSYDIFSKEFVKLMDKVSNGRVKVELFTPGALSSVQEMITAVSKGMYQVGFIYPMSYAGTVPMGDIISGLPSAWSDDQKGVEEVVELFWGKKYRLIDVAQAAYAKKGIYFFGLGIGGDYPFLVNFPIKSMQDLQGRKIRASGAGQKWLARAGASSVFLPGGEIYMAMKLGTIDGTVFPTAILDKLKLKEVVKYAVHPGLTSPVVSHIINQKAWDALPADIRAALTDEVRIELFRRTADTYIKNNKTAEEDAKKYGVQFSTLPDSEVKEGRRIALPVWDEVAAKDEFCAKGVEILKQFHKDRGNL